MRELYLTSLVVVPFSERFPQTTHLRSVNACRAQKAKAHGSIEEPFTAPLTLSQSWSRRTPYGTMRALLLTR